MSFTTFHQTTFTPSLPMTDITVKRMTLHRNRGFNPTVIYDIGANVGDWTTQLSAVYPGASFVVFEANPACLNALNAVRDTLKDKVSVHVYCPLVLAEAEGPGVMYESKTNPISTGNSLALEDTINFNPVQRLVKLETLAHVCSMANIPLPQLVKIDTQGSELRILSGGMDVILATSSPCEMVILETKILPYNKTAPLMIDTMVYMSARGWQVMDVVECHYLETGELTELDLLFVRHGSKWLKQPPY